MNNENLNETSNVETKVDAVDNNVVKSNKSFKNNKIIIALISVVLVAIGGYFLYSKVLFNSKNLFLNSINNSYKDAEDYFDELTKTDSSKLVQEKSVKSTYNMGMNLSIDDSLKSSLTTEQKAVITEINKLKINTTVGYDLKNKEMIYGLGANSNNSELIKVLAYGTNQKFYIELKNLYDKYISIPTENYDTLFASTKTQTEDAKYIAKAIKDKFLENLEKDDFKKSTTTIKINNKKVKVTKIEYSISEKSFNELSIKVMEDLLKDKKFIKKIASISSQDESKIKTSIQDEINELKDQNKSGDLSKEKSISMSVYLKGITNKTVGFEVLIKDKEENKDYKLTYLKDDKIKEFNFYEDNKSLVNITFTKQSNTKSKTVVKASTLVLTINKKVENDVATYDFDLNTGSASINLTGSLVINNKEVKKDEKYTSDIKITANLQSSGMKLATLTFDINGTTEYGTKLTMPNFSNSISYTELTETDYNKIMTKLSKNKELVSLFSIFQNMSSSTAIEG